LPNFVQYAQPEFDPNGAPAADEQSQIGSRGVRLSKQGSKGGNGIGRQQMLQPAALKLIRREAHDCGEAPIAAQNRAIVLKHYGTRFESIGGSLTYQPRKLLVIAHLGRSSPLA